jgi:ubiquinone/menaquinone biosynthesis C-methylase UbiE
MDHPVRGRLNAWLLSSLDGQMHQTYGDLKAQLLSDLPPTVVELGPGTGANMRYLPPGTRLIAIEPNRQMHARLKDKAAQHGIHLELHEVGAEALHLPSESVDLVFSSLVLCSVSDPKQVIAETKRVLCPGGRFICIEHVAAPRGSTMLQLQKGLAEPWQWLFEGCHLCRDTEAMLRAAGFARVELQQLTLPAIFLPIRHQIAAVCVK